jgi:hypothetical protein
MSRRQFNPNDCEPRRFALKYDPPQIIMEYCVPSLNKLYHHKIKLPKLKYESKIEEIVKEIYEKHSLYLNSSKVNKGQIVNLVDKLKSNLKPIGKDINLEATHDIDTLDNLISLEVKSNNDESPNKLNNIYVEGKAMSDMNEKKLKEDITEDIDLNELELAQINKVKDKMNVLFDKNTIKPGDTNYKYDIRKKFTTSIKKDSEWDSDNEDNDNEDSHDSIF